MGVYFAVGKSRAEQANCRPRAEQANCRPVEGGRPVWACVPRARAVLCYVLNFVKQITRICEDIYRIRPPYDIHGDSRKSLTKFEVDRLGCLVNHSVRTFKQLHFSM